MNRYTIDTTKAVLTSMLKKTRNEQNKMVSDLTVSVTQAVKLWNDRIKSIMNNFLYRICSIFGSLLGFLCNRIVHVGWIGVFRSILSRLLDSQSSEPYSLAHTLNFNLFLWRWVYLVICINKSFILENLHVPLHNNKISK